MNGFSLKDKLIVLRFSRLGRIPPAQFATELLSESHIPVEVIEFGADNAATEWIAGRITKRRVRHIKLGFLPAGVLTLLDVLKTLLLLVAWTLKEGRPRLLLTTGLYEQWIAYVLFRLFGVPYVVAVHEVYDAHELSRLNRWFLEQEKNVLASADLLLFPVKERAEFYRKRYGFHTPSQIVFNCPRKVPADSRSARDLWGLPSDAKVVGYLGGLGKENFLEETIEAVSTLSGVYFLYWGWGDEAYLEHLRRLSGKAPDRIRWMGIAKDDKWSILRGWDLGLCLYRPDLLRLKMAATASNKLFECLAVGCPVLTSNAPDFAAFLSEHPVGVAVPELTVAGIRSAIRDVMADRPLRERLGDKARALHESQFHFETQFALPLKEIRKRFPADA